MPIIIDELELWILINALYLDAHRLVVGGILWVESSIHVFVIVQFTNVSTSRLLHSVQALVHFLTAPTPAQAAISLSIYDRVLVDVFDNLIGFDFWDLVVAYLLLFFEDFGLVLFLDELLLLAELCLFVLVHL